MKLYGCAKTRSDRVRWALEEAGAQYEYIAVDLGQGEGRTAAFRAMNPDGKVPVLEVDGQFLLESAALCRWIADRHPEAGLIPPTGSIERARCEQWCDFAISELEQPLWTMGKHRFALPPELRLPAIAATADWEFQRAAAVLAKGLGTQRWILGERFSVADILLGHTLAWAKAFRQDLSLTGLEEYAARALSRPALQRVRSHASPP